MSAITTLRIHYDTGVAHKLFIRGDAPGLNWEKGIEATWKVGNVWTYQFPTQDRIVEFKVLIDDRVWQVGLNYRIDPGVTRDFYPHFHSKKGELEVIHHFDTPIVIYLPPSYHENPFKHYPVIYMHDGQNLFDPETAFGGQAWAVDKTMNRLVLEGQMEEVIGVGIYNRGAARIHDFTPSHDPEFMGVGAGGGAENYLHLIADEIKPHIDTHYRTRPSREHTGLLGSSLGGLVSFYMAREQPEIFSKVASLSSSFWWNRRNLIRRVIRRHLHIPMKIYLDAGSRDNEVETLEMYRILLDIGYRPGSEIFCHIAPKAAHNERFWGQRVHLPLRFLFPCHGHADPNHWREESFVLESEISQLPLET